MSLTVVTHTDGNLPMLLERCINSVQAALPQGAYHQIVQCTSNWAEARLEAAMSDEFVAFVDSDDTITPTALQQCIDALATSGAGVATTYEHVVDIEGRLISKLETAKLYENITKTPLTIHHLCVIRRSAVDTKSLDLHRQFGLGIDWFIKASAALTYGAVCVPTVGYYWTRHPNSMSARTRQRYIKQHAAMSDAITKTWGTRSGIIPLYGE